MLRLVALAAAIVATCLPGCSRSAAPLSRDLPDLVWQAIEQARKSHSDHASVSSNEGSGLPDSLDEVLGFGSVVILRPARLRVSLTTTTRFTTWSTFEVTREIGKQAERREFCEPPPTGLRIHPNEFAMGFLGGKMTVDGLPFEWHSPAYDLSLVPERSYLAVVVRCPNRVMSLVSALSVFEVSPTGQLQSVDEGESPSSSGLGAELRALGTIDRIARRVANVQKKYF